MPTSCGAVCNGVRHTLSLFLTLGSLGLIFYCIAMDYAALPGPAWLHYMLFVFSIVLLAYLEGLQVAILSLEHVSPTSFPVQAVRARASHRLATGQRGLNVQRFLVGRQFFVVFVVFLSAQLTTYPGLPKTALPEWLYVAVINTGLPGALVVLAFGQLMPQLIAATHPVTVMNLVGSYQVIQLALGFEFIGITHFSWLLAEMVKRCSGLNSPGASIAADAAAGNSTVHEYTASGNPNESSLQSSFAGNPSWSTSSPLKPLLDSWHNIRRRMDLDVGTLDTSQLYEGAERGMEASSLSDIRSREMVAWLQTQSMSGSRNLSSLYEYRQRSGPGSKSKSENEKKKDDDDTSLNIARSDAENTQFPSPADITRFLIQSKRPVPRYLLPPHHDKHIPPHIVAFDLVRRHDVVTDQLFCYQSGMVTNQSHNIRVRTLLTTIYAKAERGQFPELDQFMEEKVEEGIPTHTIGASIFMSPSLEPLLVKSTMPDLKLNDVEGENFSVYRQNYHNFRKGKARGSEGEVKHVLNCEAQETQNSLSIGTGSRCIRKRK